MFDPNCEAHQQRDIRAIHQSIDQLLTPADVKDFTGGTTGCDSGDRPVVNWLPHEAPDVTLDAARRAGWKDMPTSEIGGPGSGVFTTVNSRRLDLIFFQVSKTFEASFAH